MLLCCMWYYMHMCLSMPLYIHRISLGEENLLSTIYLFILFISLLCTVAIQKNELMNKMFSFKNDKHYTH